MARGENKSAKRARLRAIGHEGSMSLEMSDSEGHHQNNNDSNSNSPSEDEHHPTAAEHAIATRGDDLHAHVNPQVNALVTSATQMTGSSNVDGATLALAALQTDKPDEALMYLAAASAKNSIDGKKTGLQASRAVVLAQIADEGVATSDYDNDKRFSRVEKECSFLELKHEELKREVADLQERLARAEGMLGQLLCMVLHGQTDPSAIADMLRNLGL